MWVGIKSGVKTTGFHLKFAFKNIKRDTTVGDIMLSEILHTISFNKDFLLLIGCECSVNCTTVIESFET